MVVSELSAMVPHVSAARHETGEPPIHLALGDVVVVSHDTLSKLVQDPPSASLSS